MLPAFDVVVVPDFSSPPGARVFAARTLFFLGSWLENAGEAARHFPLHLVCIGEPPAGVRRLAERCGATVHVRETLRQGRSVTINKLRGLEIGEGETGRTLLVDADVFVLGDFSALADAVPDGIAAAPAGAKWVTEAHWQRIYEAFGLPLSAERAPTLAYELGLVPEKEARRREYGATTDLRRMLPYHNTGVVLVPREGGLRELWADHQTRIRALFEQDGGLLTRTWLGRLRTWLRGRPKVPRAVSTCDQAGFASAVQLLRGRGVPFRRLPDPYHARRVHSEAGALTLDDMKIYHAAGFLRGWDGDRAGLPAAVDRYIREWQEYIRLGAPRRARPATAETDAARVETLLRSLLDKYVLPALE